MNEYSLEQIIEKVDEILDKDFDGIKLDDSRTKNINRLVFKKKNPDAKFDMYIGFEIAERLNKATGYEYKSQPSAGTSDQGFYLFKLDVIKVDFEEKFKQILKEESEKLSIDSSLADIKFTSYYELQIPLLGPPSEQNVIRMIVIAFNGTFPVLDVDDWFRSCRFTYNIYYNKKTESERKDMFIGEVGTIKEIAIKIGGILKEIESA